MMARALDDARYRSPRHLQRQIAMLVGVGELLMRGIAVPDDMRKAAFGRPRGALKFVLVVADLADELARFDRYERRALSRRKAAVAAFDAARARHGTPVLMELPAMGALPNQEKSQRAAPSARRWRNKATRRDPGWRNKAAAASGHADKAQSWTEGPMAEVSYREATSDVCQLLDIDWPLRLELPRDGPQAQS
jgi:hypothetical protein